MNAHGEVYANSEGTGSLVMVDPNTNEANEIKVPTRDDPKTIEPYLMSDEVDEPSPYFGNQILWTDHSTPRNPVMDSKGRLWLTSGIRGKADPAFCKPGSNNVYAKNDPLTESIRQLSLYDPETKKWKFIDTCFGTHHLQFGKGWLERPRLVVDLRSDTGLAHRRRQGSDVDARAFPASTQSSRPLVPARHSCRLLIVVGSCREELRRLTQRT